MRRIATLLVGLAVLTAGQASAAPMDPYAGAEQTALAFWIERDGKTGTMYAAYGTRGASNYTSSDEVPGWGVVGKGPCHFGKRMGWCMARGRLRTLGLSDFTVDPLLASAHMTISFGGFTHVIDWTGKGTPQTEASQSIGEGQSIGAGMFRSAPATGKLYDKKMTGHKDFHFLLQGAFADSGLGRYVTILPDNEVLFRVPVGR